MNEVSRSTIWRIFCDDLNLRKVAAQWVPRSLTDKLKVQCMEATINFLQRYSIEGEDFLDHIITGDEIWVHHYTPPTKKASMVWKSMHEPSPKKFWTQNSAGKLMFTIFWDRQGVIHQEYLSKRRNSTVNVEWYSKTLFNLRTSIKNKRPGLLSCDVVFLHDNARPHVIALMQSFLKEFCWDVLP